MAAIDALKNCYLGLVPNVQDLPLSAQATERFPAMNLFQLSQDGTIQLGNRCGYLALLKGSAMQILTKVYERHHVARQVVTELEAAGFPPSSISLVANKSISDQYNGVDDASNAGAGAEAGLVVGGATGGLLAGLGALIIPGLGPVMAAGWLTTTALGAFAGGVTGGILGALIDANVPEEHAHVYSEAVRRGGTLVSIRVEDSEVKLARAILDRHKSVDPVREGEKYRESGWTQFDPASEYSPESIELERLGRAI